MSTKREFLKQLVWQAADTEGIEELKTKNGGTENG